MLTYPEKRSLIQLLVNVRLKLTLVNIPPTTPGTVHRTNAQELQKGTLWVAFVAQTHLCLITKRYSPSTEKDGQYLHREKNINLLFLWFWLAIFSIITE